MPIINPLKPTFKLECGAVTWCRILILTFIIRDPLSLHEKLLATETMAPGKHGMFGVLFLRPVNGVCFQTRQNEYILLVCKCRYMQNLPDHIDVGDDSQEFFNFTNPSHLS